MTWKLIVIMVKKVSLIFNHNNDKEIRIMESDEPCRMDDRRLKMKKSKAMNIE